LTSGDKLGRKYRINDDLCLECGHLISREYVCPFCGWTRDDSQVLHFFPEPKYKKKNSNQTFIMETNNEIDRFIDNDIQAFNEKNNNFSADRI